ELVHVDEPAELEQQVVGAEAAERKRGRQIEVGERVRAQPEQHHVRGDGHQHRGRSPAAGAAHQYILLSVSGLPPASAMSVTTVLGPRMLSRSSFRGPPSFTSRTISSPTADRSSYGSCLNPTTTLSRVNSTVVSPALSSTRARAISARSFSRRSSGLCGARVRRSFSSTLTSSTIPHTPMCAAGGRSADPPVIASARATSPAPDPPSGWPS